MTLDQIRICIVEDHRLLGQLVALEIESLGIDVHLVDLSDEVIGQIRDIEPKLVLLDVELGDGLSSPELCRALIADGVDVVLFTGVTDRLMLANFLEIGAKGILSKTSDLETLGHYVQNALQGRDVPPAPMVRAEMRREMERYQLSRTEALAPFQRLSRTEAEILALIVQGAQRQRLPLPDSSRWRRFGHRSELSTPNWV